MLWPGILSNVALFITLHKEDPQYGKWTMSRYKFFWIGFLLIFLYTWIPQYFAVALQGIALMCFVTKNKQLRFLGSGDDGEGLGMGMLSIDFYTLPAALSIPFKFMLNNMVGNIILVYIVVPILYYTNTFGTPAFKDSFYPGTDILQPVLVCYIYKMFYLL